MSSAMSASSEYFKEVFDRLERYIASSKSRAHAAERLGISKGNLTKWFSSRAASYRARRALSTSVLRKLARCPDDAALAQAAERALRAGGHEVAKFSFAHAAAQVSSFPSEPSKTLIGIARSASDDELEIAAVHDLLCAFVDAGYYSLLATDAIHGFQHLPVHPLGQVATSTADRMLFDLIGEDDEEKVEIAVGIERHRQKRKNRTDAVELLIATARDKPRHHLFEALVKIADCPGKTRVAEESPFTARQCLKVAGHAAVEAYGHESAAMEAADTLRRAADADCALQDRPLHAIATKIYEICHQRREDTIGKVNYVAQTLAAEDPEAVEAMKGICAVIQAALYSPKGLYSFQPGLGLTGQVNSDGSVLEIGEKASLKSVRTVVGRKRRAPKRAIVRR